MDLANNLLNHSSPTGRNKGLSRAQHRSIATSGNLALAQDKHYGLHVLARSLVLSPAAAAMVAEEGEIGTVLLSVVNPPKLPPGRIVQSTIRAVKVYSPRERCAWTVALHYDSGKVEVMERGLEKVEAIEIALYWMDKLDVEVLLIAKWGDDD